MSVFFSLFLSFVILSTASWFSSPFSSSSPSSRITGGQSVVAGQYPSITWQARIVAKDPLGGAPNRICGGTIVGASHIVTTAHCLRTSATQNGQLQRSVFPQNIDVSVGLSPTPVVSVGRSIWFHPSYTTFGIPAANVIDLAVIVLATPLTLSASVTPIPLAAIGLNVSVGTSLITSGWGWTNVAQQTLPTTLQWVDVPYGDRAACIAAGVAKTPTFVLQDVDFCTGIQNGKDTCFGDGGSAIVINLGNTTSPNFFALGINESSTSSTCGENGQYSTNLDFSNSAVQSFINAAVANNATAAGTQPFNSATQHVVSAVLLLLLIALLQ